jgi:hypothetical protein
MVIEGVKVREGDNVSEVVRDRVKVRDMIKEGSSSETW